MVPTKLRLEFWKFWKNDIDNDFFFFSFSLTWDPMGEKISKRYSTYKTEPKLVFWPLV